MIDSRLGRPRTDAKAASQKETPRRLKNRVAAPDLDQAKSAALNSLSSIDTQRGTGMPLTNSWNGIALNRDSLLTEPLCCGTRSTSSHVNLRRVPSTCDWARCAGLRTRRLIRLLSADPAAGRRRVKGVKKIGVRLGNWLLPDQAMALLDAPDAENMKGKRDQVLFAILVACGLRRHEAVELNVSDLQQREDHWATVDLIGKASHIGTIPAPDWVKDLVDDWHLVRQYARKDGIEKLAPHDLRRTCARLCHQAVADQTRFTFCLNMYRCRQPNDILAAAADPATPSMIESASAETSNRFAPVMDRLRQYMK